MTNRWIYKNPDPEKVGEISSALGISTILSTLLVNRNITSVREAELFLNPDLYRLYSPFLLPDMEKAVFRVRQALDRKEKILVYGDRDVDGVTSIAILVRALKGLGAEVFWAIPQEEGYGLHRSILERYQKEGVSLVITVDCGTSAVEEVAFANSIGLDVVITDHHVPPGTLPPAYAIVNPNLADSTYPMKELAGCLTAFKFAYALMFTFNRYYNHEFIVLDLETTGLSASSDEIIEIGAVCIRNFVPIKKFHTMVCPKKPISQKATEVNGITNEMVSNAPSINETLPQLVDFIGERTIVAHNAMFDLGFLQQAAQEVLGCQLKNPFIDTLSLSREIFPFRSHALIDLAKDLNIDLPHAHRAIDDCFATASLFQRMEEILDPRLKFFLEDQIDLVTLGTIADIVPLVSENRIAVKHGLPQLLKTRKVGLRKLIEESRIKYKATQNHDEDAVPTAKDISWLVTPLINAAGRFLKAELAVQLLLTEDESEGSRLVQEIVSLNQDRRNLQKINMEKFFKLAQEQCDLEKDRLIFIVASGLEHGVTGIVARQMVREFQKPVVLLINEDEESMGSSRSIPGFNIVKALEQCKDLLVKYGGHPAAAGLTVKAKNVELLRKRLKEIAVRKISGELLSGQIEIDMDLQFDLITKDRIREIAKLEPFGEGNPPPVFALKGVRLIECSVMGVQKKHLLLRLSHQEKSLSAVGWNMGALASKFESGEFVDIAFQLEPDRWKERDAAQLILLQLCHSSLPPMFEDWELPLQEASHEVNEL